MRWAARCSAATGRAMPRITHQPTTTMRPARRQRDLPRPAGIPAACAAGRGPRTATSWRWTPSLPVTASPASSRRGSGRSTMLSSASRRGSRCCTIGPVGRPRSDGEGSAPGPAPASAGGGSGRSRSAPSWNRVASMCSTGGVDALGPVGEAAACAAPDIGRVRGLGHRREVRPLAGIGAPGEVGGEQHADQQGGDIGHAEIEQQAAVETAVEGVHGAIAAPSSADSRRRAPPRCPVPAGRRRRACGAGG